MDNMNSMIIFYWTKATIKLIAHLLAYRYIIIQAIYDALIVFHARSVIILFDGFVFIVFLFLFSTMQFWG